MSTNTIDLHSIQSVKFGILSAEDIKKIAVCKIDNIKPFDSNGNIQPNSVYDKRMGFVKENNEKCPTCGEKNDCWGHPGYIELAEPILHPLFYRMIASFLKCFCHFCYNFILTEEQLELYGLLKIKGYKRFLAILQKLKKIDVCKHCKAQQFIIRTKPKDFSITMERKTKEKKDVVQLSPEDILTRFSNIPKNDIYLLGLDPEIMHPKSLVLTVLYVIPPCSRPYVKQDGNICHDDLTTQLQEIIKINNKLASKTYAEKDYIKLQNSLKFRIQTMMNNSGKKAKHPTDSRPLKGLKERLTGKQGRIRYNIMGKRVNFSARTVIGADPTLKLNQLGIPNEIARIHTKPEIVNEYNREWLTKIVEEGNAKSLVTVNSSGVKTRHSLEYAMYTMQTTLKCGDILVKGPFNPKRDSNGKLILPSFNGKSRVTIDKNCYLELYTNEPVELKEGEKVIRNGEFLDVKYRRRKPITLKLGDVVDRYLMKGDVVLFNRQPSLHRGSMLSMEVVPMPYKTFRFNLAATKSFNADFDGDEMNIHAPQSYEAEVDLRKLTNTASHIITPQESKPIITITQDSLVAAYLMTRKKFMLTKEQFQNICLKCSLPDGSDIWNVKRIEEIVKEMKVKKAKEIYNGKGLVSLILPRDFNYERKNNAHPEEQTVIIRKGVMIEGALDKNTLGPTHGSIIQILNKEYGAEITSNFIDNMQFIGNAWLFIHGFSIGIEDCMIESNSSVSNIKNTIEQCYIKAEAIKISTKNPNIREVRITAALSQAKDIGMSIAKNAMNPQNNFLVTVTSGAKGDFFNIAQLTGLLGQQNLKGHRILPVLSNGKRTLYHYPLDDTKLSQEREYESRGFIRHSFIRGLSPEEFFFHAMSGREGVADTAMGTANSGYIQRKIGRVCEDIVVKYDHTVRDNFGKVYQFAYGENNYNPIKTTKENGEIVLCNIARLVERINMGSFQDVFKPVYVEAFFSEKSSYTLIPEEKKEEDELEDINEEDINEDEIETEEEEENEEEENEEEDDLDFIEDEEDDYEDPETGGKEIDDYDD